jgi:hypothetical protein
MTQVAHDALPDPRTPTVGPPVRTAMVSTRRLALLFPSPELDRRGELRSTRLDRLAAGLRRRRRLLACRLWFFGRRLEPLRVKLVTARLRLRLALIRLRHASRLGP